MLIFTKSIELQNKVGYNQEVSHYQLENTGIILMRTCTSVLETQPMLGSVRSTRQHQKLS